MGIAYNTSIVRDGLVLYLDAANPKSYPGSGTAWNDLSGNNNHGTLGATTTFSSDGYMSFAGNGSNTEAVFTTIELNTTPGQGNTIEQWLYSNGRQTSGNMPFTFYNISLDIWHGTNGGYGINNAASLVYGVANADLILINKWVHSVIYIPFSWSSNYLSAKMWINGVPQTMAVTQGGLANQTVSSSQTVGIGGGYTSGADTYNWNGRIATTKIYNRELSTPEVLKNFEATRGRYGI